MTIVVREVKQKSVWEDFLTTHREANFLQSWNWGEFNRFMGKKIFRLGFFAQQQLLGVALVVSEQAKRGKYLTLAGGPIIEWFDSDLVASFFATIKALAVSEKAVFVRIRPQLLDDQHARDIFEKKYHLVAAPMHLSAQLTHRLDLHHSEAELLAAMRKSTRYDIRRGSKLGIKVIASSNVDDIEKFYQLQLQTAKRQHFVPFSLVYWQQQFNAFVPDNQVLLYSSFLDEKLLAQAMIIFYGQEAVYHYGASSDLARQYPGAAAIQWAAIKEAKKRGMSRYNFWGVAPLGDSQHRFGKLSTFKRGFGGSDYPHLPAHDLVINPWRYKINLVVEISRKKLRKV